MLLFFVVALILIGFVSTNNSLAFMICYLTAFVALIVGLIFVFCRVSFVQRRIEKEIHRRYVIMHRKSILALDLK